MGGGKDRGKKGGERTKGGGEGEGGEGAEGVREEGSGDEREKVWRGGGGRGGWSM